jgi:hypothetical protein
MQFVLAAIFGKGSLLSLRDNPVGCQASKKYVRKPQLPDNSLINYTVKSVNKKEVLREHEIFSRL